MQTTRGLSAPAAAALILLGACGGAAQGPCAAYEGQELAEQQCYTQLAQAEAAPEKAAELCDLGSADCRSTWILAKGSDQGYNTVQLLDFCGKDADCAMVVLDQRPAPMLTQVPLCEAYAGKYVGDCIGHVLQRWWESGAEPGRLDYVLSLGEKYPDRVAFLMGAGVACPPYRYEQCQGTGRVLQMCMESIAHFQMKPQNCPSERHQTGRFGGPMPGAPPGQGPPR